MYCTGPVRMQAGAFVVLIWPLGLCTVVAGRMRGGLCGEVKDRQTSSSVWGCLNEYIRFTESSRAPRPADTVWEWRSWAMWSDGVCDAFRRGSPTLDSRNTLAHTPKKIPDPVETSSKQTWQIMLQQESSGYQQVAMLSLCIKTAVKKALYINMRPALILFITPSSTYRKASKGHRWQLPVSVLSLYIHTYDQTKVNSSSLHLSQPHGWPQGRAHSSGTSSPEQ